MPVLDTATTPYYGGGQVPDPANVIHVTTTPSAKAIHNNLGTIAVENSNASVWILGSKSGGTATWVPVSIGGLYTANAATTAAMSGTPGAITTSDATVTTSSIILFSRNATGGTPGQVSITAQSAGSFTLTSTGNETSTFNYTVINQV